MPSPLQGDYVMPTGVLGFDALDVAPHKVGPPAWALAAHLCNIACLLSTVQFLLLCLSHHSTLGPPLSARVPLPAAALHPRPPAGLPCLCACLQVTEGLPIEYLRHYRAGGYDFGTLADDPAVGAFKPSSSAR